MQSSGSVTRPLRVGEPAPTFDASDGEGTRWSTHGLAGRAFVLYFYPQDETPGCVAEACAFRDEHAAFAALDVLVLGVSRDDDASHRAFAKNRRIPFPLLCDPTGAIHAAYGAVMLGGLPRRVSYLIGADLRVVAVFDSHLRPAAHAEKMMDAARALRAK